MNKRTQPAFYRQKILLAILHAFGGKLSKLDLQKLLFLYIEEAMSKKKAYEFIPYHYGCYSFQANADLRTMHNYSFIDLNSTDNLIKEKENSFNPIHLLKEKDRNTLFAFFEKYKNLKGDELIAYVYKNYPYYTLNSKIAYRFLDKKYKKQPILFSNNTRNLFTIGYEGITFENYINKLIFNNIQTFCDVRKNPFSMKFGFSKNILKHALEQVGIKYIHLPELGIESEDRQTLNTLEDYKILFQEYEHTTIESDDAKKALEYLSNLSKHENIALTCFEKDIVICQH